MSHTKDRTTISLVGIGPGDWRHLTLLAAERLGEEVPIFSRLSPRYHPVLRRLEYEQKLSSMFHIYALDEVPHAKKYELFADIVINSARAHGRAIYAVPGNVFVFERTPHIIVERCEALDIEVEVVPGLSSIEAVYAQLGVDPGAQGMQILDAHDFGEATSLIPQTPVILLQVFADVLDRIKATLLRFYPPEHTVVVAASSGFGKGQELREQISIDALDAFLSQSQVRTKKQKYELVSIYIPALDQEAVNRRGGTS